MLNTAEASTLSTRGARAGVDDVAWPARSPQAHARLQVRPARLEETQHVPGHAAGRQDARRRRAGPHRPDRRQPRDRHGDERRSASTRTSPRRPLWTAKCRWSGDFDEFLAQLDVITFHVPGGEGHEAPAQPRAAVQQVHSRTCWWSTTPAARWSTRSRWPTRIEGEEDRRARRSTSIRPSRRRRIIRCSGWRTSCSRRTWARSTDEAQTAVSVDAVQGDRRLPEQRRDPRRGERRRHQARPAAGRSAVRQARTRIGALLAGYCEGGYKTITLRAQRHRAPKHMNTLLRLATVELLKPHLGDGR